MTAKKRVTIVQRPGLEQLITACRDRFKTSRLRDDILYLALVKGLQALQQLTPAEVRAEWLKLVDEEESQVDDVGAAPANVEIAPPVSVSTPESTINDIALQTLRPPTAPTPPPAKPKEITGDDMAAYLAGVTR